MKLNQQIIDEMENDRLLMRQQKTIVQCCTFNSHFLIMILDRKCIQSEYRDSKK